MAAAKGSLRSWFSRSFPKPWLNPESWILNSLTKGDMPLAICIQVGRSPATESPP